MYNKRNEKNNLKKSRRIFNSTDPIIRDIYFFFIESNVKLLKIYKNTD